MSNFKFSLLAVSVGLCFATQVSAASYLGSVTINGASQEVTDLSNGFTINGSAGDVNIHTTEQGKAGITLDGQNLVGEITANKLTVTSDSGRGIQAYGGADIKATVSGDMVVNVENGDIGIWAYKPGSSVDIKANSLTVNAGSNSDWGIHVQNATQTPEAPADSARVTVVADTITINGGKIGVSAYSNGQMDLTGDITVTAERAIETRGNATININKDGTHKTVLNGDIVFGTPATQADAHNSGNLIDANLNVNLVGEGSVWTGRAFKECAGFTTIESDMEPFYGDVEGFNVQLSKNATWNVTGDSFVNELGVKDGGNVVVKKEVQKVNAGNVELSGGSFDVQGDTLVSVKTLSGTGGAVSFTATLNEDQTINSGTVEVQDPVAADMNLNVTVKGITADDITDQNAAMESLNSKVTTTGESKLTKVNTIGEGDVKGSLSQSVDAAGNAGAIKEAVNQKLDGYSSIAALSAVQWRHENDTLLKRMGELRDLEGTVGAWARLYGSEQEYGAQSVKTQNTTIQVGADYDVGQGWKVGGAFSYTDGSSNFDSGNSNNDMYGLAVYGTWLAENGQFVDLIGKYSRLSNEFTSGTMKGDFDNNAFSLAAEAGWHFKLNDLGYVEPSAGLTYGRIMGDNFTAQNGVLVEQEDYDSLIARVGVRSGFYFPNQKGNIYARVAVLHDFMGDMESMASKANDQGKVQTSHLKDELGETWVEYGLGANFKLSKTAYTFVDLEKTAGGDVKEAWKWTLGARLAF